MLSSGTLRPSWILESSALGWALLSGWECAHLSSIPQFKPLRVPGIIPCGAWSTGQMGDCLRTLVAECLCYGFKNGAERCGETY